MANELKAFGLVKDVTAINGVNEVTIRFTDSYRHEVEFTFHKDELMWMLQAETDDAPQPAPVETDDWTPQVGDKVLVTTHEPELYNRAPGVIHDVRLSAATPYYVRFSTGHIIDVSFDELKRAPVETVDDWWTELASKIQRYPNEPVSNLLEGTTTQPDLAALRAEAARLRSEVYAYHKLLHDIDQCAPAVLNTNELGLDFTSAIQAVRDELEKDS